MRPCTLMPEVERKMYRDSRPNMENGFLYRPPVFPPSMVRRTPVLLDWAIFAWKLFQRAMVPASATEDTSPLSQCKFAPAAPEGIPLTLPGPPALIDTVGSFPAEFAVDPDCDVATVELEFAVVAVEFGVFASGISFSTSNV